MKRKKSSKELEPKEQLEQLLSSLNHCDRVRQSVYSGHTIDEQQPPHQHKCKIGIYGWRKKFLYILIILIAALVIINAALTLWIVTMLNFSMHGLGSLKLSTDGLILTGNAFISENLYATKINSRTDHHLQINSDQNLTLFTTGNDGSIGNKVFIGDSKFDVIANQFSIKGKNGKLLFEVNDQKVSVAADTLNVDNTGGIKFDRSIQTPLIESSAYKQLHLISPQNRVRIIAPLSVAMESRFGDISATSLRNLRLKSTHGKIILESSDLQLRNLKLITPSIKTNTSAKKYPHVYQLCICSNSGILFTAPPDQPCSANSTICTIKHRFRTITEYVSEKP